MKYEGTKIIVRKRSNLKQLSRNLK